jgi:LCP family protein required for cell wall assembly
MKNQRSSIDGFVPRRSSSRLGGLRDNNISRDAYSNIRKNRELYTTKEDVTTRIIGKPQSGYGLGRSDIDESLNSLDDINEPTRKLSRRQRRRLEKQSAKKPKSLFRRILKWFIILVIVAILSIGGYTAYKLAGAGHNIFQGSILDIFKNQPLKQDTNGRSNFLILGTSEDDPGHEGANLTDSMMVVSVDQTTKDVYIFSIPRDLYVQYGMGCDAGYAGKINAYFSCANTGTTTADEQDRLSKTEKFIGDIFGIDIQYGVHVDQTVIKQAVDAVGGIDIDIEGSNGAPGVLDRNFDWRCNYTCYLVKYTNGVHHLDGEHALFLAQARGDVEPTYGLANSNFDREVNQQKILIALKNKAMTTGILTNLSAVNKLIDAFGSNLRTDIQTNEIRTLMQLTNEVKSSNIHTISLVGDNPVVMTDNIDGASVVVPSAGTYDYSDIRALMNKNLTDNPVAHEAAPVIVSNGTDQAGIAQTEADKLTAEGFNIALVNNAPDTNYTKTEIYQIGTGNTATAAKLTSIYNVAIKKTTPPVSVDDDTKFVVIIGEATKTN